MAAHARIDDAALESLQRKIGIEVSRDAMPNFTEINSDAARAFATAGGQLDALQQAVHEDLRVQVAQLNQLAAGVADVNQRIAAVTGLGQPPNDLLDERERLLGQISEHLQISTVAADDGTVGVFIAGGQRLVLGSQAQTLSVELTPSAVTVVVPNLFGIAVNVAMVQAAQPAFTRPGLSPDDCFSDAFSLAPRIHAEEADVVRLGGRP